MIYELKNILQNYQFSINSYNQKGLGTVFVSCLGLFFPLLNTRTSFLKRIFLNVVLFILKTLANQVGKLMTVDARGQGHEC